jgi:hypothetical protein
MDFCGISFQLLYFILCGKTFPMRSTLRGWSLVDHQDRGREKSLIHTTARQPLGGEALEETSQEEDWLFGTCTEASTMCRAPFGPWRVSGGQDSPHRARGK